MLQRVKNSRKPASAVLSLALAAWLFGAAHANDKNAPAELPQSTPSATPTVTATPTSIPAPTPTASSSRGIPKELATPDASPPAITPGVPGILIEDFSSSVVGEFPIGWRPKGNNGKHFYRVAEEAGRKYLKVDAIEDGTSIFREVKWDVKQYPILEWQWRGRILPKNGNEGRQSTNDCTVALYVIFPIRWLVPDSLKYSWSTTLPVGKELTNGMAGKNKTHVVRMGDAQLGQWVVERRNIYEDYKRRFDREPANPLALGVITDADNTHSTSSGDYSYFRVLTLDEAKELPLSQ